MGAQDHGGLLLLATAAGNGDMVAKLGLQAEQAGKHNVSFLSYFMLGQLEKCLQILLDSNRIPEAAFFARTYLPSEISRIVELWREQLSKVNENLLMNSTQLMKKWLTNLWIPRIILS